MVEFQYPVGGAGGVPQVRVPFKWLYRDVKGSVDLYIYMYTICIDSSICSICFRLWGLGLRVLRFRVQVGDCPHSATVGSDQQRRYI